MVGPRIKVTPALVLAALALGACAQGPADFVADGFPGAGVTAAAQPVRTAEERDRLARDLDATAARQASEGRSAGGGLSSAMALSIIRQQQEEEARALLEETAAGAPAPPCDPAIDPTCVVAAE